MTEYHFLLIAIWITVLFIAFRVRSIEAMINIMFDNQHEKPPWYRG